MNYRQVEAVLSDLLIKCEEQGVALPVDALDAIDAVLEALQSEFKHELGRSHMDAVMERLVGRFGLKQGHVKLPAVDADTPQRKRRAVPSPRNTTETKKSKTRVTGEDASSNQELQQGRSISPKARRKKTKHKLLQEIEEKSASRKENQPLVDQLVQLGEYEMRSGHTQRGVARLRAAKEVRNADEVIKSGAQARKLDRIGPSAAAKVDAILNAGINEALREYKD
ncbi:hypothetical protein P43SY_003906 [Pythium insidiosum]|uniref:Crossover junction endonuclease MUS81-like HHH domain-containing protein n=1 Tax=Pythium insidiosum TaxID=114742 RepID=A0AAD5MDH1_PYTIN|nr:hypothetical protein P43SY_003906 [Pythium insidiosum]